MVSSHTHSHTHFVANRHKNCRHKLPLTISHGPRWPLGVSARLGSSGGSENTCIMYQLDAYHHQLILADIITV